MSWLMLSSFNSIMSWHVKHQRFETAASGSGKSGVVKIGDVESLKKTWRKKVGVNAERQALSVEVDIDVFSIVASLADFNFFLEDWCTHCQEQHAKNPYDRESNLWECVRKDMGNCRLICEQCQLQKQECSYQIKWKAVKEKKKGKATLAMDSADCQGELEEFCTEVKTELVAIREEMEEMRVSFDRGLKKTREEVQATLQSSLAEITGMFTGLVEEVERNRDQLESFLNLSEEDRVENKKLLLVKDLIDFLG